MKWRVYYGDDSTFSDQDGGVDVAPFFDVQVIVQADKDHGWRTQTGDYYVWDDRGLGYCWWGVDDVGLIDYLHTDGWKRVLLGRKITSNRYNDIMRRALEDPDFPEKTSYAAGERIP